MLIEAGVAVTAGITAGSLALTSFGFDSVIELASATLVLGRLRAALSGGRANELAERRVLRIIAPRSSSWRLTSSSARSSTWSPGHIRSDHRPGSA
jgi:hypothetical protein